VAIDGVSIFRRVTGWLWTVTLFNLILGLNYPVGSDVDHSLLRSWLGLPHGPWPPNHYTLLGLPTGRCDPASVERLVLARMAQLRPHQLLHPELVTEGMNRLAQALICLTDPVARSVYDAELGVAPLPITDKPVTAKQARMPLSVPFPSSTQTSSPLPEEPIPGFPIPTDDLPVESSSPQKPGTIEVLFETGLEPPEEQSAEFEVVEPNGPSERLSSAVIPYEVVWDPEFVPPVSMDGVIEAELVAPPAVLWQPADRRQLFARIALVRRFLAAWQKLKPVLANPQEAVDRPVGVLTFLEAVAEIQPLVDSLKGLVGEFGRPGGLVTAVVRQPLVLSTLRTLLPSQRRAIAIDWLRAELAILQEQTRLRELMRSGRSVRRRSRFRWRIARRMIRWFIQMPEVILVVLAAATLIRLWIRSRAGP
jgi:hypothetical protein